MSSTNKLLRQYYGLETPDKEQEARDIDSPDFDAKSFFDESVRNDSLQQLLARENSLVSDIRAFDNDLQSLVYDNYSKFLGASDIVRSFSTNISTLTDHMDRLSNNLTGVAGHSNEINTELEPNRQKIHRLMGIARLLGRVEFISKLPKQLRACLKTEKYSNAVNVWIKVEGILSTQQHFPSFQRIHEECVSIMDEIKSRIRGQMLNADLSVEEAIECASLLVKLQTPLGLVCSQLAHHRFLIIDNTLETADMADEPFELLSQLKELAIDDAETFIKLFKEKLLALEPSPEAQAKINGVLLDFQNNTFERISQLLPFDILFELDCNKMASYLSSFVAQFTTIATQAQINMHLHKILQQYTEAKTMKVFKVLTNSINNGLGIELYNNITKTFDDSVCGLIQEFTVFTYMDHHECAHFLIQQLALMFDKIFNLFETADPKISLVLAIVCIYFSDKELHIIFNKLLILEPDSPLHGIQEKLTIDCKVVAHKCLANFVRYRRFMIDSIITEGINGFNWTTDKEPTDASTPTKIFIKDINDLYTEINELLGLNKAETGDSDSSAAWRTSVIKSASFYTSGNQPSFVGVREEDYHQIDRLFTSVNRLHLSKMLSFDVNSIITSIVMYCLKTFLELIRLHSYSCSGFNQVQVDGYLLYECFNDKLGQTDLINALIEEIISSSADQTVDPVPLDVSILRNISDTTKSNI